MRVKAVSMGFHVACRPELLSDVKNFEKGMCELQASFMKANVNPSLVDPGPHTIGNTRSDATVAGD
jgi:hypothetical protein